MDYKRQISLDRKSAINRECVRGVYAELQTSSGFYHGGHSLTELHWPSPLVPFSAILQDGGRKPQVVSYGFFRTGHWFLSIKSD